MKKTLCAFLWSGALAATCAVLGAVLQEVTALRLPAYRQFFSLLHIFLLLLEMCSGPIQTLLKAANINGTEPSAVLLTEAPLVLLAVSAPRWAAGEAVLAQRLGWVCRASHAPLAGDAG